MSIVANTSVEGRFEELIECLESSEPVPTDTAEQCATYLRAALECGGSIDLGRSRGRPAKSMEKLERAVEVAWLRHQDGQMTVEEAAGVVGRKYGIKFGTVKQDYKKHGQVARKLVLLWGNMPQAAASIVELGELLAKFRHDDGSYYSKSEIDDVLSSIRAGDATNIIQRINDGGFRYDRSLLAKCLT